MRWQIELIVAGTLALHSVCGSTCSGYEPKSGPSIEEKRDHVLKYFESLSDPENRNVLIGQNVGHSSHKIRSANYRGVVQLRIVSGKTPGLLGIDHGFDRVVNGFEPSRKILRAHWNAGGIVTISMHPPNPWHSSEAHDTRIANVGDIFDDHRVASIRWKGMVDRVAQSLVELQSDGVIVLWRPLHEANGDWFWWGGGQGGSQISKLQYVRLWREMYDDLTKTRKLKNLIWVYSPTVQYTENERDVMHFYPGDDVVDMVALDYYSDHIGGLNDNQSYDRLVDTGKPLGIMELGPSSKRDGSYDCAHIIPTIQKHFPRVGYVMFWHSWRGATMSIVESKNAIGLMNDEHAITLDKVNRDANVVLWKPDLADESTGDASSRDELPSDEATQTKDHGVSQ